MAFTIMHWTDKEVGFVEHDEKGMISSKVKTYPEAVQVKGGRTLTIGNMDKEFSAVIHYVKH